MTHPPDIVLIFDIVIAHNGDEPLKKRISRPFSPNIIQLVTSCTMRWTGHVLRERREICLQSLVGKPGGKELLLKHWIRSEDSIKIGKAGGLL